MKKISVRLMVALGAFALSAVWMILSLSLRADPYSVGASTKTFPLLITSLMLVFSAIISIQEFIAVRKSDRNDNSASRSDILRVLGLVAVMVAYVFLLKPLGFVISSVLLLIAAMLLYGFKNKLVTASVAILFPLFLKLLFEYALKVQLP